MTGPVSHQASPLTVREFCERVRIGKTFFYEQVKAGRIEIMKAGRKTLVPADQVEFWNALCRGASGAAPIGTPEPFPSDHDLHVISSMLVITDPMKASDLRYGLSNLQWYVDANSRHASLTEQKKSIGQILSASKKLASLLQKNGPGDASILWSLAEQISRFRPDITRLTDGDKLHVSEGERDRFVQHAMLIVAAAESALDTIEENIDKKSPKGKGGRRETVTSSCFAVAWLMGEYMTATGRKPGVATRQDQEVDGPFIRFAGYVLDRTGISATPAAIRGYMQTVRRRPDLFRHITPGLWPSAKPTNK